MKHKYFKQCIRKGIAAFMAGVAACSLLLSYTGGVGIVEAANDWSQGNVWIGATRVTADNCGNIFNETGADGNPTARYDLSTETLYLNGVNIRDTYRHNSGEYALYTYTIVKHLVITGENYFSEGEIEIGNDTMNSSIDSISITGTGTLRCKGKFDFNSATCPDGMYLVFGDETEKTGPTIDAKGGVRIAGTGLKMYGGVLKGFSKEGNGFDHVINGMYKKSKYLELYNDSILMAKKGAASSEKPVDALFSNNVALIMGENEADYFGWAVYRSEDAEHKLTGISEWGIDPTDEDYSDTEIDVLGFTEDATVYSVDVEWGAMTFQYENTTWDATAHKTIAGAEWKVYDSENSKALDTTQDAINQIKVINHSNADVYATLDYAAVKTDTVDYSDTTGAFTKDTEDADTQLTAKAGDVPDYLTLGTADNSGSADVAGTPTTGTVFFMPSGIKEEYKTSNGITKWSQIGTITVGIKTEQPSA